MLITKLNGTVSQEKFRFFRNNSSALSIVRSGPIIKPVLYVLYSNTHRKIRSSLMEDRKNVKPVRGPLFEFKNNPSYDKSPIPNLSCDCVSLVVVISKGWYKAGEKPLE